MIAASYQHHKAMIDAKAIAAGTRYPSLLRLLLALLRLIECCCIL